MPNRNINVAAVILCWNNSDIVGDAIQSLLDQSYPLQEIVVVDNASNDDSVAMIKQSFPEVALIENSENSGFAKGNNIGIKHALIDKKCEFVLLLNSDARLDKKWLENIFTGMNAHKGGAGYQGLTLDYGDHQVVDSYGITVNGNGSAIQLGYGEKRKKQYKSGEVFGVNAAACLYSAAFLRQQPFGEQYFDEDLFMYLEDVDLALRSVVMGWENYFITEAIAYHMGSVSGKKKPTSFGQYYVQRNHLLMLAKNFPITSLLKLFLRQTILTLKDLKHEFKARNYTSARNILKARCISILLLPKFLIKRARFKSVHTVSKNTLMKKLG